LIGEDTCKENYLILKKGWSITYEGNEILIKIYLMNKQGQLTIQKKIEMHKPDFIATIYQA